MDNLLPLILVAAVIGGLWLWFNHRPKRAAEEELRRICLGNERQVERLIEGEITRAPGMSRADAAQRAVERYRRDNR